MSRFYVRYAKHLAVALLLLLPLLVAEGESLVSNNNIETWLPVDSRVRQKYDRFKEQFGAEEVILIGLPEVTSDDPIVEALASRIEALDEVRQCWTPGRFATLMRDFGVPEEVIDDRLAGLAISHDRTVVGVMALLSEEGLRDRSHTVEKVQTVLDYCQLAPEDILLTGAPVVVAELNRLGSTENNRGFFFLTQLISLVLLYISTRDWRVSGCILLITVFAIELTQCCVKWTGGETNFILSALPVMVMVFTLAIAVHLIHYYRHSLLDLDPLGSALAGAWKPSLLATITTTIGLLSLTVSDIAPVRQFGLSAGLGAIMALVCGLGLTPIVLALWPNALKPFDERRNDFSVRLAHQIVHDSSRIVRIAAVLLIAAGFGLFFLKSRIDPLDFLPRGSKVVSDLIRVERDLTNIDSIEVVVDFGVEPLSFVEKLKRVQSLEERIAEHPAVRHTMSLGTFFPPELPSSALEAARLFSKAQSTDHRGDFMSVGERYWRISARVHGETNGDKDRTYRELSAALADEPVVVTGIAPLIEQAQRKIFIGFWESFAMAFLVITVVMVVAVRSFSAALMAMIPNLTPIAIVFGILGWLGIAVDIGMMMTASIALGIAVDGTFHYLMAYRRDLDRGSRGDRAAWVGLLSTGSPIFQAGLIASAGMLALTQSSFNPTVRFGWMMSILLVTAICGDLILLPALLAWPSHLSQRWRAIRANMTSRQSSQTARRAA